MRDIFTQLFVSLFVTKIGAAGFEPTTSWSQTRRSSQAELRPVKTFNSALWLSLFAFQSYFINYYISTGKLVRSRCEE